MSANISPTLPPAAASPVRDKIVSGARRRFLTTGFRGVTMDELANDLGMSKKTLYAHFTSKTALLEAVITQKIKQLDADLEEITSAASADFPGALQQSLLCVQRHAAELQPAFIHDVRREAPELFRLAESLRAEVFQRHFGRLFTEGRRHGIIRRDVPTNLITEILLGATQAIVNPTKLTELDLTVSQAASGIISVVLQGVITEKGKGIL